MQAHLNCQGERGDIVDEYEKSLTSREKQGHGRDPRNAANLTLLIGPAQDQAQCQCPAQTEQMGK